MSAWPRMLASVVALALWLPAAQAVMPGERMDDPALERRARALYQELRCVVCQNQSIDDSDAEIAADLRAVVRERLRAGDDDDAVLDFVVARYGTFVLLEPPMTPLTYALWFGPPALLIAGIVGILIRRRRRGHAPDASDEDRPLSDDERTRLAALLDQANEERRA